MHEATRNPTLESVGAWNKSRFCLNCMAAVQMAIVALRRQAVGQGPFVIVLFYSYSSVAGHVVAARVCFDSLIFRLTSLINSVVSVCGWNDIKRPIRVLICGRQPFRWRAARNQHLQDWFLIWQERKDSKIPNALGQEGNWQLIFHVLALNVMFDSVVLRKYDITKAWSHCGAHWWRSTGRSLLSERWADYQLWNNSRLALPSAPTSGHACAPTSRGLPVMILFVVRGERQFLLVCFQRALLQRVSDASCKPLRLYRAAAGTP